MRIPNPSEMSKLSRLSDVREKMAMLELSRVVARQRIATERINELRGKLPDTETVAEGLVLQRWLVWRDQELKRRLGELALIAAEYAECAKRCGRIIAENAVVEEMSALSFKEVRTKLEKRQAYETPSKSHLLAHNVCDKNI